MIIKFSTKRDVNGNRYFLGIDTEQMVFSRTCSTWYAQTDVITISYSERAKLIKELEKSSFTEISSI